MLLVAVSMLVPTAASTSSALHVSASTATTVGHGAVSHVGMGRLRRLAVEVWRLLGMQGSRWSVRPALSLCRLVSTGG